MLLEIKMLAVTSPKFEFASGKEKIVLYYFI